MPEPTTTPHFDQDDRLDDIDENGYRPADAEHLAARRRAKTRRRLTVTALQILITVVVLGLWEFGPALGIIDPFFFSQPSAIVLRIVEWFAEGKILNHLGVTLLESLLGLVIGGVSGLFAGIALGRSPMAAEVMDPFIAFLNSLPRVVLAPIFLLWFGLGIWSKVAFAVTLVFFIVFFNTFQGVREVDRVIVDNARMLGAKESQLLRTVFIPSALTWIFSSLHVSVGFAIVGAVVGEYMGSSQGVGYVISQAEGVLDTTGVFAGIAVLGAVVLVIDLLVQRVERYLLRWKPAPTHEVAP